jgi:hypothetical protein
MTQLDFGFPTRAPRSDYELDDVASRVLIKTWEKAVAKDEDKRKGGTDGQSL